MQNCMPETAKTLHG